MKALSDGSTSFWRRAWVFLLVGTVAIGVGFMARRTWGPGEPRSASTDPEQNEARLEFALDALDGSKVAASDFSGRVLVVDFWATWCGPCRIQDGILRALHERFSSGPVSFVAINVGESVGLVRDFDADDPFAYQVLMDPAQTLSAKYGIYALPTVMVLDGEQRILFKNVGVSTGIQIASAIERALGAD